MANKTYLKTTLAISIIFVLLGVCGTVHAEIIYVDDDLPADFNNIQAAIDSAGHGDVIIVNPGTYTGEGNRDIDFLGKAITVRSIDPNNPNIVDNTIIDCNGTEDQPYRGFYFHNAEEPNSILGGFTIMDGYAPKENYGSLNQSVGGGIFCRGSHPTIINCIIKANTAGDYGGGICCWGGSSPKIINCNITDNIGGGIWDYSATIINCTIKRNNRFGISCGSGVLIDSTISDNEGVGIDSSAFVSPTIINCKISGNIGGGIDCFDGGDAQIINCLISGNRTSANGGGINCAGEISHPTISNCTIVGNTADGYGGGIFCDLELDIGPMVTNTIFVGNQKGAIYEGGVHDDPYVNNCLFYENTEGDYYDNETGSMLVGANQINSLDRASANIDADPCFVELGYWDANGVWVEGDYHLLASSPCIDAGDPNYIAEPNETDLDGRPRVIYGRIDMGAYEFLRAPQIIYVDDNAPNDPGPGDPLHSDPLEDGTQGHPFDSIQESIDVAQYGDTVIVLDGLYTGNGNHDIDFNAKAIAVRSENGPKNCIVDCQKAGRGFQFHSSEGASSLLDGFTITNGYAVGGGGAINCNSASPTIRNCVICYNMARHGAGIYCSGSSPTISNCTFTGNSADDGGGMYNDGYEGECNPILINCVFSGNYAGDEDGGGMYNFKSSPRLTYCTFSGNSTDDDGGAIYSAHSSLTLTDCTFIGNSCSGSGGAISCRFESSSILTNCTFTANTAYAGGGMHNIGATAALTNCIFNSNSATEEGGGLYNKTNSITTLTNCTFSGNLADIGGGMCNDINSTSTLDNCILWDNNATTGPQIDNDETSSAIVAYSDVQGGWPGQGNIDADPCFVEPGYWDANGVWVEGDYHLLSGSPCINAGDPNYVAEPNETDLDGKPRIIGDRIDMGAYEYSPHIPAEVWIVPRSINLASKGKWITASLWLGKEYDVFDIDPNSVFLEGEIQAELLKVDEEQQVAVAKFSRSDVQEILNVGEIELTITGRLTDGTVFEGTDVIRVLNKAGGKSAK